jgi:SAM-dependent methyltransferase
MTTAMKDSADRLPTANTSKNTHNVVAELLFADAACATVLDIPCGEGAFTERCLEKGLTVYAADCQDILKIRGARFSLADMDQPLPFESGTFDGVVCIDGIEHIERPFDFVRECRRMTRLGGTLILSTPNITALRSRWRWLLTGFHNKCKTPLDERRLTPSHHLNMLSLPKIRYMLHSNGFQISAIRANRVKWISWPYGILAPLSYLATQTAFREEKNKEQRCRNREILRQIFSVPVLFGETLIVKATAVEPAATRAEETSAPTAAPEG